MTLGLALLSRIEVNRAEANFDILLRNTTDFGEFSRRKINFLSTISLIIRMSAKYKQTR